MRIEDAALAVSTTPP